MFSRRVGGGGGLERHRGGQVPEKRRAGAGKGERC